MRDAVCGLRLGPQVMMTLTLTLVTVSLWVSLVLGLEDSLERLGGQS